MKTGRRLPAKHISRLLGVLAFVAAALLVGAGLSAAADGPWPPVPSDADLQTMVTKAVQSTYGCSFVDGEVHGSCTEIHITKMHLDTFADDSARLNRIVVDYKETTGPSYDGTYTTQYEVMWAGILQIPPYVSADSFEVENAGNTLDAAWATFKSQMGQLLPGWDLRPVNGHGASGGPGASSPDASPTPELPLCEAAIEMPANLTAGDTLSPSATVTSADGKPIQGTISEVWTINGVQANSVTWDGKPAQIVLQLSCQGHAQDIHATYNGTLTQGSTSVVGGSPDAQSGGETPGLEGVGDVPGPANETEGVVGMLAPGVLGILGGLLVGGFGGGSGGSSGGTTVPVAPDGPNDTDGDGPDGEDTDGEDGEDGEGPDGEGPDGAGPDGKGSGGTGSGGKEGTSPGGKGPAGPTPTPPAPAPAPAPYDAATQVAIDKLAAAMNRAAALKNPAMIDAISDAQANAFDANGHVIPEKFFAAIQGIRGIAGSRPGNLDADAEVSWAATDAAKAALGSIPTAIGMAGGAAAGLIKGVGSGAVSAVRGVEQIGDAIWNYKMFGKGLDAEMKGFVKGAAGAEVKEANDALKDGRYLDALGAEARGIWKVTGAIGGKAWGTAREILPVDEVKSLFDPNASTEERLWAVPAAATKIAGLLLGSEAGVKPVPGISRNTTFIPSAAPGYAAGQAAKAAAAQGAETMQAAATAAQKVETTLADALGGKPAPKTLAEGKAFLAQHPEVREAVHDAIRADGGSGALRDMAQNQDLSAHASSVIAAGKRDLATQAMNNASKEIAEAEVARCQDAGQAVPKRILTSQASESLGAHPGSDIDRCHYVTQVGNKEANQILDKHCANLPGGGFDRKTIGANAYVAEPGTLMDTSAADTNQEAWLRRNLGGYTGQSGSIQTHVSSNGTTTVADHIGGAQGTEALPMDQRFGAPRQLTPDEMKLSAAEQIPKLDKAVAANNISDSVKYTARAVNCGAPFEGSREALMQAAMTKDPALQVEILRQAGITSVAELRGMLGL